MARNSSGRGGGRRGGGSGKGGKIFTFPGGNTFDDPDEPEEKEEDGWIRKAAVRISGKVPTVAEELMLSIKPLGRTPTTPEEKEQVFANLARLKAQRKTHQECADALGVSVRTIVNYLADPLYVEMVSRIELESRNSAIIYVSDLTFKALATMEQLMDQSPSDFVRFKAAEAIGRYIGLENLERGNQKSSQEAVVKFLQEATRVQPQITVNQVYVNQQHQKPEMPSPVIEAGNEEEPPVKLPVAPIPVLPPALREKPAGEVYQVLPGGMIPDEFLPEEISPHAQSLHDLRTKRQATKKQVPRAGGLFIPDAGEEFVAGEDDLS